MTKVYASHGFGREKYTPVQWSRALVPRVPGPGPKGPKGPKWPPNPPNKGPRGPRVPKGPPKVAIINPPLPRGGLLFRPWNEGGGVTNPTWGLEGPRLTLGA